MRCGNCGFQNPDSNVRCEKCNAPLSGSMLDDSAVQKNEESEQMMRRTKREIDSSVAEEVPSSGGTGCKCPNCDFELSGFENVCPICGNDINGQVPQNQEQNKRSEEPKQDKAFHKMTVSPWEMLYKQYRKIDFYLEPIALEGEKNVPDPAEFSGEIVALKRENTETQNLTISSENQAEIRCISGQYYILDTSNIGSTFVQAKNPMAINEGDVILMGNRRFVFKKENQ